MKISTRLTLHVLIVVLALTVAAKTTRAQDPVKVDPDHYKVLYEDQKLRVLEYKDEPGHRVPKHSHPHYVVVVISPATREFFKPDCKTLDPPQPVNLTAGEITPLKPPVTHCEYNNGQTNTHLIVFEYKDPPKKSASQKKTGKK
ncbi:MAG TPA: hypothetical protein VJT82_03495 [Pyrinomonadaceae bacterium]|nr:hypothetical protein [Pyrinomonadaceae bacterium]